MHWTHLDAAPSTYNVSAYACGAAGAGRADSCQRGQAPASFYWHVQASAMSAPTPTGDDLLEVLATLASPHRLRVVAALVVGRNYVSRLARELGISRALLQLHLKKLESAGLVSAHLELSEDGKAMKFYEVTPFAFTLTPETLAAAARTLSTPDPGEKGPQS
jgi:DNA-binding transcriptional ArsR family regulator